VFELRWALQGTPGAPAVFQTDPGFLPLLDQFTRRIKKVGYGAVKEMAPTNQLGAYGVARRFYRKAEQAFPLMQVGPGIFATNESSLYKWTVFKAQIIRGLKILLASYPKLGVFQLTPSYLELRYIDVFDKSLPGNGTLFRFLEKGTTMAVSVPPMLSDTTVFSGEAEGRFIWNRSLVGSNGSRFILDIGSGKKDDVENVVRMESKVICTPPGVPKLKRPAKFIKDVDDWLEVAHSVTSPFFEKVLLPEVLMSFAKKKK
jgi:uncharacterized protein (TIGR04255 family)